MPARKLTREQVDWVCELYDELKAKEGPSCGRYAMGYGYVAKLASERFGCVLGASTVRDWINGRTRWLK